DAVPTEPSAQRQERRRGVTEDAGLTAIALEETHVPRPHQFFRRAIARMLAILQSGVDIKCVSVFVIKGQIPEEVDLLGWNLSGNQLTRRIEIGFATNHQWHFGVLSVGAIAARWLFNPDQALIVNKVEQHLLVIAAQAEDAFGILAAKFKDVCDTA